MNIDSNRQQTDGSDELALLNEELMWLIAYDNLDQTISVEDAQAPSDQTRKITGINNKPILLSSAAIFIAGVPLFTPDHDDLGLANASACQTSAALSGLGKNSNPGLAAALQSQILKSES